MDVEELLAGLARVRAAGSPEMVLEAAPRELCAAGVFTRVLLSGVRGSLWSPHVLCRSGVDGGSHHFDRSALRRVIGDLNIPLASPLVEAEVVRRRLPALVQDIEHEPRTYRPLVERSGSREYVVAPVVVGSSVIALLHADAGIGGRSLTMLDRDLIRMFADGVGLAYEYAGLVQRMDEQRDQIARAAQATTDVLNVAHSMPSLADRSAVLGEGARMGPPPPPDRCAELREASRLSRLTCREREVLALLASGATNAQLADQLTVAESTVKSHVKHILHKLGAGNRAAAIACYLREARHEDRWAR